jgi:radical SAM superfamily enzyme YgiQ (UPF0313 family)
LIDYDKYIAAGGSPALQIKAGCPFPCGFCVEARKPLQQRALDRIMDELRGLLARGIDFLFIADAEFNNHIRYAEEFCDRILAEGLTFKWSAYLNTIPLTASLVKKMKMAGCVMPCVSVVSGDDHVLQVLDTQFTSKDIRTMGRYFQEADFPYTVDVAFGGPGETLASAQRTVKLLEEINPRVVGMNLGLRLYANTGFGQKVLSGKVPANGHIYGMTENNDDLFFPIFYISDLRVRDYLKDICDSDPRYRLLGYSGFEGINYKTAANED